MRLGYRTESGAEWEATVDPWSVIVRHGRWYLLCRRHRSEREAHVRAYRIDRVQYATPLDETFEPPADLDPIATLEAHLAVGWDYAVDVVVDAPLDRLRGCVSPALGRLEPIDATTTRLVASTSNPSWYAEQLAVLPCRFWVVGGPELRHTVRAVGERFLAATGKTGRDEEATT